MSLHAEKVDADFAVRLAFAISEVLRFALFHSTRRVDEVDDDNNLDGNARP